jgi:hypothetical protein
MNIVIALAAACLIGVLGRSPYLGKPETAAEGEDR